MKYTSIIFILLSCVDLKASENLNLINTSSFSEILIHIEQDTLVVCDIDDTLIYTTEAIGRPVGREFIVNTIRQLETKSAEKYKIYVKKFAQIFPLLNFQLCDPQIPVILNKIQKAGTQIIALTARPA